MKITLILIMVLINTAGFSEVIVDKNIIECSKSNVKSFTLKIELVDNDNKHIFSNILLSGCPTYIKYGEEYPYIETINKDNAVSTENTSLFVGTIINIVGSLKDNYVLIDMNVKKTSISSLSLIDDGKPETYIDERNSSLALKLGYTELVYSFESQNNINSLSITATK